MLLLPLIIEHTIDERSPLCGHTHDSLAALNAVRAPVEPLLPRALADVLAASSAYICNAIFG